MSSFLSGSSVSLDFMDWQNLQSSLRGELIEEDGKTPLRKRMVGRNRVRERNVNLPDIRYCQGDVITTGISSQEITDYPPYRLF